MKFFTKSRIARFLFSVPVFKVRRLFLCRVFFLFFRSLSSSTPTSSQPANERTRWQRNPTVFFFVHYLRGSASLFVCKNLCIFFSVCMCIFLFYFLKKFSRCFLLFTLCFYKLACCVKKNEKQIFFIFLTIFQENFIMFLTVARLCVVFYTFRNFY